MVLVGGGGSGAAGRGHQPDDHPGAYRPV